MSSWVSLDLRLALWSENFSSQKGKLCILVADDADGASGGATGTWRIGELSQTYDSAVVGTARRRCLFGFIFVVFLAPYRRVHVEVCELV